MKPVVSVIICTKDRADSLRDTLVSVGLCNVPSDMPTELLVVDNGSRDHTRDAAEQVGLSNLTVRYIYEPRMGKGFAYNTGMAEANGGVFLFTDDDVRVPVDWIECMCRPIARGDLHAVQGGIRLATHLVRPWMESRHLTWLASTERLDLQSPEHLTLIGANMAFSREVLAKVAAFDTDLGPGALGFKDEILFSMQLREAGFSMSSALDCVVEHHVDLSRFGRKAWLDRAVRQAQSDAYVAHHWAHRKPPGRHVFYRGVLRLLLEWLTHPTSWAFKRVPRERELEIVRWVAFVAALQRLEGCPRNYELRGLTKLAASDEASGGPGEECRTEPLCVATLDDK